MRQWTALLMALLLAMMPLTTLAEGYEIKVYYDLDGEAFTPVLEEAMQAVAQLMGEDVMEDMLAGMDAATLSRAAELLLDATSFTVQTQPDGLHIVCNMRDQYLCSVFVMWNEQEIALSTNLLPNVKLTLPLTDVYALADKLAAVDWSAAVQDIYTRTVQWAASLRAMESVGSFGGDAYAGGVRRVSYDVTDADIADLVDSILLGLESNASLMTLLNDFLGENQVREGFRGMREYNMQVRQESKYHYDFSRVYAKEDVLIGFSLNVLEAEELIASASLGANEAGEQGQLVISIPLGSGVVYMDARATVGEKLSGSFAVYQSASLQSYQQVREDAAALIQRQTFEIAYTPQENGHLTEINTQYTGKMNERTQTIQIVMNEPYSMVQTSTLWMGETSEPVAVTTMTVKESSKTTSFQEGLTEINMSILGQDDAATQAFEKAWSKGVQEITVNLFKALPPELLTMFMMPQ